ncbi:MAG: DUF4157 domain-containing protein [Myxococcales bacterium]|nr:DUF4157 domain-containing protein [Myxococcales bacterium]
MEQARTGSGSERAPSKPSGAEGGPSEDGDLRRQIMASRARQGQASDIRRAQGDMAGGAAHAVARAGVAGAAGPLPHLDAIQAAFGRHDVSGARAVVGGPAQGAAASLGAKAYVTEGRAGFAEEPDPRVAAHEAAHLVQQAGGVHLAGGVGVAGDRHEQHADAVAERVVAGESAEALLDEMAPAAGAATPAGAGPPGAVQLAIADDLHEAVDGLGTDEDAIFERLARATPDEKRAVLGDASLMAALRDDLSGSDMERVLDLLGAPLADKLRLAMDGIGTSEDYIHRSLAAATPDELRALASDRGLIDRLKDELSGEDLRRVMRYLSLAEKLRVAVEGMGTDEPYLFESVIQAPIAEVQAVAADAALMAQVEDDLSGADLDRWRGLMARRLWVDASDHTRAFDLVDHTEGSTREARLAHVGAEAVQHALLDAVIASGTDPAQVIRAFQSYWAVAIGTRDGATMSQWPLPVLRQMHAQLKALPDQDTRAGYWNRLTLSDHSLIDPTSGQDVGLRNRAAFGGGDFTMGTQASTGAQTDYGYGTALTAPTSTSSAAISVEEGDRLDSGSVIRIGSGATAEGGLTITAVQGTTWTLDKAPAAAHVTGERVTPDDGSAERTVNWLDATVRHEIAHGIDENMAATVRTFTVGLGGWWTGDFDGWIAAMPDPWRTSAAQPLTDDEKRQIKEAIVDAVTNQKGSLYGASMGLPATHPVIVHQSDGIPVIVAAEACLQHGDGFYAHPQDFFRDGGKAFTVSFWYKRFMYFEESIIGDRVKDYALYAPTEFFAEAYTVFYEEAGRAGVSDADHGRLIRNASWRDWMRTNIHERNQAPAGTGASGASPGAAPGSSARGRAGGDPGP